MREGILGMSASERDRASLVRRHVEEGLSQREASERLGIGVRQFKRLVRDWRREGDAGMMSRQRGRPSNNRLAPDRRAEITAVTAAQAGLVFLEDDVQHPMETFDPPMGADGLGGALRG
jgi:transposase